MTHLALRLVLVHLMLLQTFLLSWQYLFANSGDTIIEGRLQRRTIVPYLTGLERIIKSLPVADAERTDISGRGEIYAFITYRICISFLT